MSREFGDNQSPGPFLHDWIDAAAAACLDDGSAVITFLFGEVFESMYRICWLISSIEASDWSEGDAMPGIAASMLLFNESIKRVNEYLSDYNNKSQDKLEEWGAYVAKKRASQLEDNE